jgi:hypothetical protein
MREKQMQSYSFSSLRTVAPKCFSITLHLLVFHAYINEKHGSRSKILSKTSRHAALLGGI